MKKKRLGRPPLAVKRHKITVSLPEYIAEQVQAIGKAAQWTDAQTARDLIIRGLKSVNGGK